MATSWCSWLASWSVGADVVDVVGADDELEQAAAVAPTTTSVISIAAVRPARFLI
jgi:hypothetical protein